MKTMFEEFRFRPLKIKDCRKVAAIRLEAKEWGFLPAMGEAFYTELMKATCESKYGFGIVCIDKKEEIAGFVCAAIHLQKYYLEIILRRGIILVFRALMRLIRQPKLIAGLIQYFRYPQKTPYKYIKAEWLTMIVKKEYRNMGIGKKITFELIEEYRRKGVIQFKSTVPSDNRISCAIHDQFGFKFLQTFELSGVNINIYIYNL
jgi:RimJ/RimL family protein N-acetyltransferase